MGELMIKSKRSFKVLVGLFVLLFILPTLLLTVVSITFANEGLPVGYYEGYADETVNEHLDTKISSKQDVLPSITFFVHGQGGNASHWSNDGQGGFIYDNNSAIERLRTYSGAKVYWAKMFLASKECELANHECTSACTKCFKLFELKPQSGKEYESNSLPAIKKITDVSQHMIVVFESTQTLNNGNPGANTLGHDVVYAELHQVIDTLSYDYKYLTGSIPKINLIGHSRGGITNLQYATEHPYNVDGLVSMGTPYIGSNFGELDMVVKALGLEGSLTNKSGQDIMSVEKQQELKNNWNTMQSTYSDAEINAHAIGSITTASFISQLIDGGYLDHIIGYEGKAFWEDFNAFLIRYGSALIAHLVETMPNFTMFVLRCIDIGLNVADFFDDEDNETRDTISAIINFCDVAYGEFVINDDMFIDYESQSAEGFDGFIAYKRKFDGYSSNYEKTAVNHVPIPHNLETRDDTIITYIIENIEYGHPQSVNNDKIVDIETNYEFKGTLNENQFFYYTFTPKYTAKYSINTEDNTQLRKIVLDPELVEGEPVLINDNSSEINVDLTAGKEYRIYIRALTGTQNVSLTFNLPLLNEAGTQQLESGKTYCYELSFTNQVVKRITSSLDCQITIWKDDEEVAHSYENGIDYLYEANEKYIIKITPNQTSSAELKVIEGRELIIDENKVQQIEVYDTKSYMRLQPDEEQTYTVTLSNVPENSVFSVNVLDDDFKTISVVKFGEFTNQIIRFAVNANQTYYMVVNSTDGSSVLDVKIKEYVSDYSWKVNGQDLGEDNNVVNLRRDNESTLEAYLCYNGEVIEGDLMSAVEGNIYLNINQHLISISEETPLTLNELDDYQYVKIKGTDYDEIPQLKIRVIPGHLPTLTTSDSDGYKVNISNTGLLNGEKMNVALYAKSNIGSSSNTYFATDINSSGKYNIDISSIVYGYLAAGTYSLEIESITIYQGSEWKEYNSTTTPELFEDVDKLNMYGYFSSGNGSDVPYGISTLQQLKNIEKVKKMRYVGMTGYQEPYIDSNYRLIANITMTGMWTPTQISFEGDFDGNYRTIYDMTITINNSNGNFGLFGLVEGEIKNLTLDSPSISGTNNTYGSSFITVGFFAGYSYYAELNNCDVRNGTINISEEDAWVGGITGFAVYSQIIGCDNWGTSIRGNSDIGGIVGLASYSSTKISGCWNSANIYYVWGGNRNCGIAGIVGRLTDNATVTGCRNQGLIKFDGEESDSKSLSPYMAQIVGYSENGNYGTNNTCAGSVNQGNLKKVGGFLGIGAFNQAQYVNSGVCGYAV